MNARTLCCLALFFVVCLLARASDSDTPRAKTNKWGDTVWDQWAESQPHWLEAITPFRVMGNIHYVGTNGIASYLFASSVGHILLDGGMPQSATLIAANIEQLGFNLNDVKYLINSHAHFDHSGGLAELKLLTGGKLIASSADTPWLESGNYPGSNNKNYSSVPVRVDATIRDQEVLKLGNIKLKAELTPGHSPGCTSWRTSVIEDDKQYQVVLFCSGTVAGNRLVNPPQHKGIVEDYRATYAKAKKWKVDVYLANHPEAFGMAAKRQVLDAGNRLAFVDSAEFAVAISKMKIKFEERLAAELNESSGGNKQ